LAYLINEVALLMVYKGVENEASIINQAGRQRMLSQNIAKLSLLYANGEHSVVNDLRENSQLWGEVHRSFTNSDSELSIYYFESDTIRVLFDELDESQQTIEASVNRILEYPGADYSTELKTILDNESRFLVLMDRIVNQMESESEQKAYWFVISEMILSGASFVALLLTIIFVFIPIIKEMRSKEEVLEINLKEKQSLLAEIHHRVKNNLAVISGILQLQIIKKEFSPFAFSDAVNRVQSIARIHELLYQTEDFSSVKMDDYVTELVDILSQTYPELGSKIEINVNSDSIPFTMEQAVPFALLLNELITNSIKHGFNNGQKGEINIQLALKNQNDVSFIYSDNGKGIEKGVDINRGIGMELIDSLLQQLEGENQISYSPSFNLESSFRLI